MNVIALKRKEQIKKFTIVDTEHLIDTLKDIMPISKDIAILNIRKYGFIKEEDYILESLGFNISNNKKLKVNKDVEVQAKLFSILFSIDKNCFIRLRNKETGQYRTYSVQALQDKYRLQAILKSKHFDSMNDMMYSLNCYNNMYKATEQSLFSIQNIALDVDFDTNKYTVKEVMSRIKAMYKAGEILTPNIIEYGHRIRLIYSLEDVGIDKTTYKSLRLVKKVAQAINNKLPKEFNSSVQQLTTFGRIVGSINTKNNKKIQCEIINPNKYMLRELQEQLLEPLVISKKIKTIKKNDSNIIGIKNTFTLNLDRLSDLEKIQTIRQYGHREYLCFLYRNQCLLNGDSKQIALKKTLIFNSQFKFPLTENQVKSDTKNLNRKTYLLKNETILEKLQLTNEEEKELKLKTIISNIEYKRRDNEANKKRYKDKLKEQGKLTKKEQLEEIYSKIKSLLAKGLKQKDISIQLNIKPRTLKRYIKYIKENS